MTKVILEAHRSSYSTDQIAHTMTVGELIEHLQGFEEDAKIYLSHANGYTFGAINARDFEEEYLNEETEEEE